jgi:cold shock CspA family protein
MSPKRSCSSSRASSIAQDGGGPEAFAHYSNISGSGFRELQEGRAVTLDITQAQGRCSGQWSSR